MAITDDITDDLFKAIGTFQSLKSELHENHTEYYDGMKKIFERTMQDLSVHAGKFLHEVGKCQPSEDVLEKIVGAVPSSLSRVDENGRLPIQTAAWDDGGDEYVHFFAKEGIKHNVGGDDNRGGLLMGFTFANYTYNVLQLLSGMSGYDDDKNALFDASCVSTMKKLQECNLFRKEDVQDYDLLRWSCGPESKLRFEHVVECDSNGLKTHKDDGLPLIHYCIKRYELEHFSVFLKQAVKHYPNEIGLLFQKDVNDQTACEEAFIKFGIEDTMKAIGQCIPSDETELPILHHVLKELPQHLDTFAAHYPSSAFSRDSSGRTINQTRLTNESKTFTNSAMFFIGLSDDELSEFDPLTDACPFVTVAARETSDLNAVYYLLRRKPCMIEATVAHLRCRGRLDDSRKRKRG